MKMVYILLACISIQLICVTYLLDKQRDDMAMLLCQHNALAGITRSGGPANMQPVLDWGKQEGAIDVDVNGPTPLTCYYTEEGMVFSTPEHMKEEDIYIGAASAYETITGGGMKELEHNWCNSSTPHTIDECREIRAKELEQ